MFVLGLSVVGCSQQFLSGNVHFLAVILALWSMSICETKTTQNQGRFNFAGTVVRSCTQEVLHCAFSVIFLQTGSPSFL